MAKSKPSKKALSKARRHNPIRIPDSHLPHGSSPLNPNTPSASSSNATPLNPKQTQFLPVLEKLQSTSPDDRAWASSTISTLISNDPATRRMFLGKSVLERLITLLSDTVGGVQVEASGALRNLAIDGGHEVCGAMYNKQILTPLGKLVPRLSKCIEAILTEQPITVDPKLGEVAYDGNQVFMMAENVLTLFWCLSETHNKALNALNQMNLAPFLLGFITHRSKIPAGTVLAAAQCLYAITLDNPPFNAGLPANAIEDLLAVVQAENLEMFEMAPEEKSKAKTQIAAAGMQVETEKSMALQTASEDKKVVLRVLIAGVLHNLNDDGADIIDGLDNKIIGPILRPVLDVDLAQVVQEVEKTVPEIPTVSEKDAQQIKEMRAEHRSPAEIKLESIEKRLSTLMVALEVMTSVCAGLVDTEEAAVVEEEDEDEADEEMEMDENADVDEALIAQGRDQDGEDSMMVEQPKRTGSTSLDGLMGSNMHTRLFALAHATPLSYPPVTGGLSLHPPTTAFLSSIHLRALEALNNLLLTISSYSPTPSPPLPTAAQDASSSKAKAEWKGFVQSSFSNLNELWEGSFEIAQQVVGHGAATSGTELLNMKGQEIRKDVLEILAGVWIGLARIGSCGGLNITHDQIAGLVQLYTILPSINLKTRIISALATLAMTESVSAVDNKTIGDLFISLVSASPANSTEEIVAALNAIFDVYSDERCSYNDVFASSGYLPALTAVVSKCKAMTRGVDKRKQPELRAQAEEAYENLVAFIKYRRSVA